MKKIFLATAFFIGGIALMNAQEIEISESNVDLGNIKYGGKAVSTVQIKNTGDKPLIISDAKALVDVRFQNGQRIRLLRANLLP